MSLYSLIKKDGYPVVACDPKPWYSTGAAQTLVAAIRGLHNERRVKDRKSMGRAAKTRGVDRRGCADSNNCDGKADSRRGYSNAYCPAHR